MKLNFNVNYSQADPYVIKYKDTYYMYSTGRNGVYLSTSKNFIDWEYEGICYIQGGQKEYWAPSVIEINNKFYMYVSSMPINSDDVHQQHIVVAVASTPKGPFKYIKDLLPPFSIDSHVVKSGDDFYIFYSINDYEAERAGTLIVVDKMVSPLEVSNNPKVVVRPTLDEEIFMENRFKAGQHWHTLEGAFYLRVNDYHYILYSGNCYEKETYYIGYAVAKGDLDDLTKLEFKKYPDENTYLPLLSKNNFEEGTGHNSYLEVDGKHYLIYHGRDYGTLNSEIDVRTARICEISINKENIKVLRR